MSIPSWSNSHFKWIYWNFSLWLVMRNIKVNQCPHLFLSNLIRDRIDNQPQIRWEYPLNLSILISGGKENNSDSTSNGEWRWKSSDLKSCFVKWNASCSLWWRSTNVWRVVVKIIQGKGSQRAWKPRWHHYMLKPISEIVTSSRAVWDCSLNYCGVRPHRKLNTERRPIAKKYCEGKVKRTLKRELKELEIVMREAKSSRWSSACGRRCKSFYLQVAVAMQWFGYEQRWILRRGRDVKVSRPARSNKYMFTWTMIRDGGRFIKWVNPH